MVSHWRIDWAHQIMISANGKFSCLQLNNLLKFTPLYIIVCIELRFWASRIFSDILIVEVIYFILLARKYHWYKRWSSWDSTVWSKPTEQRTHFSFTSDVWLSMTLFWYFKSLFHPIDKLLGFLFGRRILKPFILFLSLFLHLDPRGNIEGIWPE